MNFFYNAGMDVGGWELYSFGSYGVRDANGAGFYRRALDARNADWDNGGAPIYEDGYLPVITSTIHDIALAGGLRGEAAGWNLDLSINYGSNRLDYGDEDSVNVSLGGDRSEEHTSELQSPMRISYAVFCLKKKKTEQKTTMYQRDTINTSVKHRLT